MGLLRLGLSLGSLLTSHENQVRGKFSFFFLSEILIHECNDVPLGSAVGAGLGRRDESCSLHEFFVADAI